MSQGFTRTPTGMIGSRYFFPQPIIWVEGPTDIYFYEPIVGELNCSLRPFYGASNATALIEGLKKDAYPYPYAIVLDGDYGALRPRRSVHRWVVILRRYSFENYLWEKDSLNRSCLKHAQCGERRDVLGAEFDRVEQQLQQSLRELIELDIAARRSDPAAKVLPDHVEALLLQPDKPDICPVKTAKHVATAKAKLKQETLEEAKKDLGAYLKVGRFSDILVGHVLFGVIQRVFTQTTAAMRGKKVILNNDGLTQLLADMVWRAVPSKEHSRLRAKILSVVRELNTATLSVRATAEPPVHAT